MKIRQEISLKQLKNTFKGLLPSKNVIFCSLVLLLIENFIAIILPYSMMKLIDKVDLNNLNFLVIIGILGIFIIQLFIAAIAGYLLIYISEYIVKGLRKKVLKDIIFLPVSYFDKFQTGEIMSRITNDTMVVKKFVAEDANFFISDMLSLVGSLVLLLIIDWKIGLIVIIMSPLTSIIVSAVADKEFAVSISIQNETANFDSLLNKVISDIRLVKSYVAEKIEINNSRNIIHKLYELSLVEGKIMSVIRPFTNSMMLVLLVTIFGYGSLRVVQGTLSAGALIAIIMYLFQMSSPASGLASFYTGYQKFAGAIKRINEIYDYPSNEIFNVQEIELSNTRGFVFEGVSFGYDSDKEILKNINFNIIPGEKIALIGPSGAGKTTIFSLIERFYNPDSGKIYYDGKRIQDIPIDNWRHKIAYVSQDSPVMFGTIINNLTYGLVDYTDKQVTNAVEHAKLREFIENLPDKYYTEVGERGVKLSGGQRQRLAIARALIRNPEILLLDEATSHLDSDSEKLVKESLDILMSGRTTLVIAHNLSTVKNADRLIILEEGVITGIGKHEELMKVHPLYQRFVNQQSY